MKKESTELFADIPARNPVLDGVRVRLRPPLLSDEAVIMVASTLPEIPHVDSSVAEGGTPAAVRHIAYLSSMPLHRQGFSWMITDRASGDPVGNIGVGLGSLTHGRAIIGCWLLPEFRSRGLGREAMSLVTDFTRNLRGVTRIEAHIETDNIASCRMVEACGYRREATLARWQIINGTPRDMHMYVVLPDLDHQPTTPQLSA